MSFIQHSIAWAKGEMFESAMMGIGGVLLLVVVLVFWRVGQTPAGLVIDFFSKERADIYYGEILAELGEATKP